MSLTFTCDHCGRDLPRNVRIKKGQKYCKAKECQNTRIRKWKARKRATSKTYRDNCRQWHMKWLEHNPAHEYQLEYRTKNPAYVMRNRELQQVRYKKRKKTCNCITSKIVKSNAFAGYPGDGAIYTIIPLQDEKIVKSNAFMARIQLL